ncbi:MULTISPECIES: hypothetical protein [unclassified Kitasatospora]|uniref:hypothetical protein n=1 Tax=unclassified Kitasatospora TaxID=2633591 RepID=UPI00070CC55D|nr:MULTISPECIES: hypothetical protein [unclassified Kitasatospora]KQV20883.1 hypothetical protein ASC99_20470 [Kitasatospora sp. Root107]KRB60463.1 hypothetical protein ASE03_12710 [Kitasatospora sp. Root187]
MTTPREPGPHTARTGERTNTVLTTALGQASWSPREFVRALNLRLDAVGEPRLDLTAAHAWVRGSVPRSDAVRRLAAAVLTAKAGTEYTPSSLWGSHCTSALPTKTVTDDLIGRRLLTDVLDTAAAWNTSDPRDQATLRPASDLFTAAWDATRQPRPATGRESGIDHVLPPLMNLLERHLAELRRLDDATGGGALSQRYVRTALDGVLGLLRHSRYTPAVGTRLLRNASGLAQLAGWMAFDADLAAAGQRYQLLAIRLAQAGDDHDTVANVLGMLAYQHAASQNPAAALRFAEAAVTSAARSLPTVRARALGRLATAHAAAGDLDAFRDATDRCHALLEHRRSDDPPALYYFTPDQVAAESGQALVDLAANNQGRARRLLAEANSLLSPLADHGSTSGYRRSALLHGIHLARANLLAHEPEATIHCLLRLTSHLPDVQSIRCRNLLGSLRRHAGTRIKSASGADALSQVDRALSAA